MLRRRCRQVAGKARLRWVLWPWALTDYYYYCHYPRGGSLSVGGARWPAAEAGTGVGGVPDGAAWAGGWGWGRGGSWWWGRWGERGAPVLLRRSVSAIKGKDDNTTVCNLILKA